MPRVVRPTDACAEKPLLIKSADNRSEAAASERLNAEATGDPRPPDGAFYVWRRSVTRSPHPIDTLLTWVKSGEIAIPEIQRPFLWEATRVRNLLDSLYQGYPVGYLIAWRNPAVRLKDVASS